MVARDQERGVPEILRTAVRGTMRGDEFFVALGIVAFAIFAVVSIAWHFSRSRGLLEQWAAENGYRIIESSYRNLVRGPFFWTTSKGQTVYRVTVEDASGRRR